MTVRRVRILSLMAGAAGALLFAWAIQMAGASLVLEGVRRLGVGFVIVWLLGGVRHFVRAVAWRLCLEVPAELTLGTCLTAYLSGDSLGNVTPFGFLVSEPSKIVLVRSRVATSASIPALAIENLFYSASVVVMLVAGTAALLLIFDVPQPVRLASLATLAATVAGAFVVASIVASRRPIVSRFLERIGVRAVDVRAMEDRVFDFTARHPERVGSILLLEAAYHAAAVLEIWFALGLIAGAAPTLLIAFVLEYINRTITIVFQFVPMWLGVDEAGTGFMTSALGVGRAAGVTLALVRKARVLVWTATGLVLLAIRPRDPSIG